MFDLAAWLRVEQMHYQARHASGDLDLDLAACRHWLLENYVWIRPAPGVEHG